MNANPTFFGDSSTLRRTLGSAVRWAVRGLGAIAHRLDPVLATIPVSAVMLSRMQTLDAHQSLEDAAYLFVGGRTQCVPVIEHGAAVGVVTRSDVEQGLARSGPTSLVGAAPQHDAVQVSPSDSLTDVMGKLRERPDAVAIVVDHGQPVGLLTFERLVEYVERHAA